MSKLFSELAKEAKKQQKSIKKHVSQPTNPLPNGNKKNHKPTSITDIGNRHLSPTSVTDITPKDNKARLDTDKLQTIITELSKIPVGAHTKPVRISVVENQDIDDFIHVALRKRGVIGKSVSSAKLMRYAIRYLMKVHGDEFVDVLEQALAKKTTLSI